LDTLNLEAATVSDFGLSKPTDPSGYELWYNIEYQRLIDEDLYLFPLLDWEGLASTPILA
jgi:hypothetical protein